MKFFIKSVVLVALSFLSITACKAQPKELATNSRKAKEYFEQANKYFRLRYIEDALNTIDKAIEKDEEFIDAYVLKAELLVEIDDLEQSINYYKKRNLDRFDFQSASISRISSCPEQSLKTR